MSSEDGSSPERTGVASGPDATPAPAAATALYAFAQRTVSVRRNTRFPSGRSLLAKRIMVDGGRDSCGGSNGTTAYASCVS